MASSKAFCAYGALQRMPVFNLMAVINAPTQHRPEESKMTKLLRTQLGITLRCNNAKTQDN